MRKTEAVRTVKPVHLVRKPTVEELGKMQASEAQVLYILRTVDEEFNKSGGYAVTATWLREVTGLHTRSISRILSSLEEKGFIERTTANALVPITYRKPPKPEKPAKPMLEVIRDENGNSTGMCKFKE